ncbi:MAG TPA: OmpA family protein [Anaeromyxobacter sp.]|nr:OmpA family protein [Anaeromyxobacter sp.]
MNTKRFLALALVAVLGAACATAGKRTAIGGGAGAAAGAGIGALVGGWKGAAIGAGVGALAGGSVGLYLDKQAKELEQVAETKRTENGVLVSMKSDILFDVGSAVLKPDAIEQIEKVGDILAKYSDDRVRIEGHADSTGSKKTNEELSLRRADAVKRVLTGRGVQEKQVTALGMGSTQPVADNATSAGRAKNRRVELHIDVPNAT